MIDIKDLKIGQTLHLVQKGYERGLHKEDLDKISKVEVIKIGRRYVTVSVGEYSETFDSQKNFKICNGYYRVKLGLYLSEKDYFDELKKEKLLKKIKYFFSYSYKQCDLLSLEDLESLNSIIDRYQD